MTRRRRLLVLQNLLVVKQQVPETQQNPKVNILLGVHVMHGWSNKGAMPPGREILSF